MKKISLVLLAILSLLLTSCNTTEENKFRTHDFYTIEEIINGYKAELPALGKPELIKVCTGNVEKVKPYLPQDIKIALYFALEEIYPNLHGGNGYIGTPNGVLLQGENWDEYQKIFETGEYGSQTDQQYWDRTNKIVADIQKICVQKAAIDPDLNSAINNKQQQNQQSNQNEIELRNKFLPVLDKLNKKALSYGYGTYKEFVVAQGAAGDLIRSGAQYALTGNSRDVQSASCEASKNSTWVGGNPGGYWNCFIRFIGESDFYAVEFVGQKWSGKIGSTGSSINWNTSSDFDSWFMVNINDFK